MCYVSAGIGEGEFQNPKTVSELSKLALIRYLNNLMVWNETCETELYEINYKYNIGMPLEKYVARKLGLQNFPDIVPEILKPIILKYHYYDNTSFKAKKDEIMNEMHIHFNKLSLQFNHINDEKYLVSNIIQNMLQQQQNTMMQQQQIQPQYNQPPIGQLEQAESAE